MRDGPGQGGPQTAKLARPPSARRAAHAGNEKNMQARAHLVHDFGHPHIGDLGGAIPATAREGAVFSLMFRRCMQRGRDGAVEAGCKRDKRRVHMSRRLVGNLPRQPPFVAPHHGVMLPSLLHAATAWRQAQSLPTRPAVGPSPSEQDVGALQVCRQAQGWAERQGPFGARR